MFRSGLDLNFVADICHPARQPFAGGVDEFGKTGVRADHGASAADDVSPLCDALRGRAQSQIVLVPRSIPVHGLCAAYLSGEPAGHRIAVSVYVLVAIVKKRLALSASLYEMLQILSLTMFERTPLDQLLAKISPDEHIEVSTNHLNLFE